MDTSTKTVADLKMEAEYHAKKAAEFAAMANDEPAGTYRDRLEASYTFHAGLARRRSNEARKLLKVVALA